MHVKIYCKNICKNIFTNKLINFCKKFEFFLKNNEEIFFINAYINIFHGFGQIFYTLNEKKIKQISIDYFYYNSDV